MKKKIAITRDQFEDVRFSDKLIVVEKNSYFSKNVEVKSLYVFESLKDKEAKAIYECRTNWDGQTFFQVK